MLGTVTALRRYPVKSMLGEDLDASDVSHLGLARDRRLRPGRICVGDAVRVIRAASPAPGR